AFQCGGIERSRRERGATGFRKHVAKRGAIAGRRDFLHLRIFAVLEIESDRRVIEIGLAQSFRQPNCGLDIMRRDDCISFIRTDCHFVDMRDASGFGRKAPRTRPPSTPSDPGPGTAPAPPPPPTAENGSGRPCKWRSNIL